MTLGQGIIDVDRIQRLQRHDGRPRLQVLTQIDLTDAQPAGKGCANVHFPDDGLLGRHFCPGVVHPQARLVDVGTRNGVGIQQSFASFVLLRGQLPFGDDTLQLGALDTVIELQQQGTGLYLLA